MTANPPKLSRPGPWSLGPLNVDSGRCWRDCRARNSPQAGTHLRPSAWSAGMLDVVRCRLYPPLADYNDLFSLRIIGWTVDQSHVGSHLERCAILRNLRLLLLEPLAVELQRPAVFRHSPHKLVRRPVREPRLDFDRHRYLGPHLAREVGDHLFGDPSGVASDARRVHSHRAVKTREARRCGGSWFGVGDAGAVSRFASSGCRELRRIGRDRGRRRLGFQLPARDVRLQSRPGLSGEMFIPCPPWRPR